MVSIDLVAFCLLCLFCDRGVEHKGRVRVWQLDHGTKETFPPLIASQAASVERSNAGRTPDYPRLLGRIKLWSIVK
jgi:hypothetical protein